MVLGSGVVVAGCSGIVVVVGAGVVALEIVLDLTSCSATGVVMSGSSYTSSSASSNTGSWYMQVQGWMLASGGQVSE